MAYLRVTAEALEHLLDLPEGVSVSDSWVYTLEDEAGTVVVELEVQGGDGTVVPDGDGRYALQYEQDQNGDVNLVAVLPVEE